MSPGGRYRDSAGRKNPRKKPSRPPARKPSPKFNGVGRQGEQIVAATLSSLKFIGGKGADFVFKSKSGHPLFFEAKTTFNSWNVDGRELKNHVLLKTKGSQWVNNKAHYVVFVTRPESFIKGVNAVLYVGKASDIRAFVKFEFERLPKPQVRIEKDAVPVLVPIAELYSKGLLTRLSPNQQEANFEFAEYMKREHAEAMRKDAARAEHFTKFVNQITNSSPIDRHKRPLVKNGAFREKRFQRKNPSGGRN